MDFSLPPDDDPRRQEVRNWIGDHPDPTPAVLVEAGYVAPGWPRPWGLNADQQGHNPIGIGWAGPTILGAGTDAQKTRFLPPLLRGDEIWCQLFSEPGAGSDLAALTTRAERDGDVYLLNGQKVWNTWAEEAD